MSSVPFRLCVFAGCGLVLTSLGLRAAFGESETTNLVTIETGDLPIILSAPHGGRDAIPSVAERQGEGVTSFKTRSDFNTAKLTEQLADALEKKLGKRPYTVIARFHRKYVDANRPPYAAYESKPAGGTYDAYHQALAKARHDVIERWGRGVLFDIHGQVAEPKAIFRGTQNGQTTTHLVSRFGREALSGETSVFGQLASQGLQVIPAVKSTEREHVDYDGGYIVVTYGSGPSGTLDAIQLELGRELRSTKAIPSTTSKLTNAIAAFAKEYLPETERTSKSDGMKPGKEKPLAVVNAGKDAGWDSLFSDDFADGNRDGWFEIDDDSSALSVKSKSGQMGSLPELTFAASDKSSLKSFAAHFPEVKLKQTGDFVTLQFDARHNNVGFVNRGFRFGLFDSGESRFSADGDFDTESISLDDDGYFVLLDLGSSTTLDSAVIRENNNASDERLWNGSTIAMDDNDGARDPLMFTRDRSYTYTLTLTRNGEGNVDIMLKNNVSGDDGALAGTSRRTPTLTLDTIYFGTSGSTAGFAIDNVIVTNTLSATAQSSAEKIRVGVYVDDGAGPSVKDLLFALGKFRNVSIQRLKADDIRSGGLAKLDLLIQPGGSGGGQGRHLGEGGRDAIRDFVQDGGGFIGICAGAYLASADYTWSLNILDAKVLDRKHWNRGTGTVDIALTHAGRQLLSRDEDQAAIFYGQGPLLAPGDRPDIEDYEVIATFRTEIAKNGAPKGVMPGTTAIARGNFGRGRVICFSPHPEMTQGLEPMVKFAIAHVKRKKN